MDFETLARACAPNVHVQTMAAIVRTESGYNPYAIGVVGGALVRQPRNKAEAIVTAKSLITKGWNFSLGLSQINRYNLAKYGLTLETAFEPCPNLRAGNAILAECFSRALIEHGGDQQKAVRSAASCYYSGNFITGYKQGYVQSVVFNSTKPIGVVRYR
jgi:type IV secretion system protein VirB1